MSRVLITGAASGLGAALAEAFAARGDEVLRTDLTGGDLGLDITSDDAWAGTAPGSIAERRPTQELATEWAPKKPTVTSSSPASVVRSRSGRVTQIPPSATSVATHSTGRRPNRSPSLPAPVEAQLPAR